MKKTLTSALALIFAIIFCFSAVACNDVDASGLWENATYLKETTIGNGKTEFNIIIEAGEQSLTLTVKTDKEMLGDALYELELINDPSFFDTLNGIKLDWDETKMYWALYIDESYANVGVSQIKVENGASYRFVCKK